MLNIFQFYGICSSIGGAISLYLGISIAMVFEVVELIIDVIFNLGKYFAFGD